MIRDMASNRKRWLKYELGKSKTKLVIKTYVRMLVTGKIEWEKLGQLYRPDQKIPVATFRRLLRQEETQRMVSEELEKLLSGEGITAQYSIKNRKIALEMAIEKGDLTNVNRALDSFDEKLDLKPNTKVKITESLRINSNLQENFHNALKESRKVTVEKEIAKPEEDKSLPPRK